METGKEILRINFKTLINSPEIFPPLWGLGGYMHEVMKSKIRRSQTYLAGN